MRGSEGYVEEEGAVFGVVSLNNVHAFPSEDVRHVGIPVRSLKFTTARHNGTGLQSRVADADVTYPQMYAAAFVMANMGDIRREVEE